MATEPRFQRPSAPHANPEPNGTAQPAAARPIRPGASRTAVTASGVVKRQHGGVRGGGAARASANAGGDGPASSGDLEVGPGVTFSGRIAACERLVVGGRVDAEFPGDRLEIRDGGRYRGEARVRSAEIHGTFEGTLHVAGSLTLGPTARVSGAIRYDTLEIAPGGELRGDVDRIDTDGGATPDGDARTVGQDTTRDSLAADA